MFQSPIFDVAIGMIFLFLLLSLLATAVQEVISGRYNLRGRLLVTAIRNMLGDQAGKVFTNPLITSIVSTDKRAPSYIPKEVFSSALINTLTGFTGLPSSLNTFSEKVKAIPDEQLKGVIENLKPSSEDDLRKKIESWYEASMDRLSGLYKRKITRRLFWMGMIIAAVLNADAIAVFKHLSTDEKARAAIVEQAIQFTKDHPDETALIDSARSLLEKEINQQNEGLKQTLGIGWYWSSVKKEWEQNAGWFMVSWVLSKVLGWIISAYAITIGAPFWFDLLKKIIQVRNAGVKPEEKKG